MALSRDNPFSDLFSVLEISFSFIDLNEDVWREGESACVCVQFTPDGAPSNTPPPRLLPTHQDPRKAEWQGSGLAK